MLSYLSICDFFKINVFIEYVCDAIVLVLFSQTAVLMLDVMLINKNAFKNKKDP